MFPTTNSKIFQTPSIEVEESKKKSSMPCYNYVRLIENKMNPKCETPKGEVLSLKKNLKALARKRKNKGKAKCGEK